MDEVDSRQRILKGLFFVDISLEEDNWTVYLHAIPFKKIIFELQPTCPIQVNKRPFLGL